MTIKNARCEICREIIPIPVVRLGGRIICCDCHGDTARLMGSGPRESGERADRQYHGSQFNRGEW